MKLPLNVAFGRKIYYYGVVVMSGDAEWGV